MELIDRAAALAAIKSYCAGCDNHDGARCRSCGCMDAMGKVDEAPTVDAVEVVRCRDCARFSPTPDALSFQDWCDLFATATRPDDYCSRGVVVSIFATTTETGAEGANVPMGKLSIPRYSCAETGAEDTNVPTNEGGEDDEELL